MAAAMAKIETANAATGADRPNAIPYGTRLTTSDWAVPEIAAFANVTVDGGNPYSIASFDTLRTLSLRMEELARDPTVDGIVFVQGTNSIEENAYFLNLTVHTRKPVIVTGAQRPFTALSSDGPLNLLNAIRVAACDEALHFIRGDAKRLAQTLDHLIENALRQTPPEGLIRLTAQRAVGEVRLQVADTGRGIPFHVQPYLFDRFVGRDRGGAGLGLALVKSLIELHGGWVEVQSEPGHGAVFTCHLPEAVQAQGVAQAELGF